MNKSSDGLTEEQTKGLFYFDGRGTGWGHWYNMDVSNLSLRPDKERFDWNIKNKWLQRYHGRRNSHIWCVHVFLAGLPYLKTPQYLINLCREPLWVNDTCFDMSHLPEYNLCLKVCSEVSKNFDYGIHGEWVDYALNQMAKALAAKIWDA